MASNPILEAMMSSMYSAKESPWGIAAQAIGAGTPYLANPYGSPTKNLGYTVGAGLLAGLLGGIGQNQADRQNAAFMLDMKRGIADPSIREGLVKSNPRSTSLWNALALQEQDLQTQRQQKQLEMEDALMGKVAERQILDPMDIQKKQTEFQAMSPLELDAAIAKEQALAPIQQSAAVAQAKALEQARFQAEKENLAGLEGTAPAGGALVAALGGEPVASGVPGVTPITHPKDPRLLRLGEADKLFDDLKSDELVKTWQTRDTGFKAMVEAYKDQGGTADVELTRRAIQAIEPGLAVRTDDVTAIEQSAAIPAQWKQYLKKSLQDNSQLPPEVREGLMRIAARSYTEGASAVKGTFDRYGSMADRYGINRADVIRYDAPGDVNQLWPEYAASKERGERVAAEAPPMTFEEFQARKHGR